MVDGIADFLDARGQEAAGGVVAGDTVAMGAKQFCERQAGAFRLEVPEADVDGGDCLRCDAGAADRGPCPAELVPDARGIVGVFADQVVGKLAGVCIKGRSACPLRVTETETAMAGLGDDLAK